MANCSQLPSEKPEVSLMPLNEEMIRMERMVGCNIRLPEFNILQTHKQETAEDKKENILGAHKQQVPLHVHTYPSQKYEPLSTTNEVANKCDFSMSERIDPQKPRSLAETQGMQRSAFNRSIEQSDICMDSSSLVCSDLIRTGDFQTTCNGSANGTEYKSGINTVNSVDPSKENSVLNIQRPDALIYSRESLSRCMQESFQVKGSTNINSMELNSPSENKPFKPGELINQLVEGPCVIIPPSQLPIKPSYQSLYAQNQRQSKCDTSSSSSNQSIPFHISQTGALNQDPYSSNCNATQNKDSVLPSESTVQYSSGYVSKTDSANQTTIKATLAGVSDSNCEQITPTSTVASATKPLVKRTPNDFVFGKVIGEGSFSTVYLAKEVSTQREFAIKVCDKKHLIRERKTHFVMREKEVLMKLEHPFFIKLAYTFQDSERLYYVLTYARNGELLSYLHKLSAFDVPCTRFYSAEIVLALEYLHGLGIIHRDLKPENILISEDMHIKITDFGTSKILSQDSGNAESKTDTKRKNSFVGTAEYVSPEVLNNQPANFGSDLWGLGCIIYQCLSGSLPFRSGNEYQTFQKIVKAEFDFPEGFHPDAKDLVKKLLVLEPSARLGMAEPEKMRALKNHSFYEEINWETLPEATPPKLMPYLPATANNPEFWGQEQRPGFDDQRLAEIITGQSVDGSMSPELEELPIKMLSAAENSERVDKLKKQRAENKFHNFVKDNLIIKQGFVDKRKGLFARKRMLLLTEGPHLFYVDAHNNVLKGEIPWSKYLRPEAKNFKIFFVHTPNRTYYLESRQPDAQDWVKQIQFVWKKYYDNGK